RRSRHHALPSSRCETLATCLKSENSLWDGKSSRRLPDVLRPHPSWEGVVHYRDSIVAPASAPEASRTAIRLHGSSTVKSETLHAVEDVTPGTRGHDAKEAVTL